MNKILTTPIGEFSAQIERISGNNVEAYLGVRYAKAEPFAVPELIDSYSEKPANAGYGIRFPQQDVPPLINRLLKMPVIFLNGFRRTLWADAMQTLSRKSKRNTVHGKETAEGNGTGDPSGFEKNKLRF